MRQDDKEAATGCVIAIIIALVLGIGSIAGAQLEVSDGVRIGVVTKASTNGLVFHTHEAGLALESFKGQANGGMSNLWEFTVADEAVWVQVLAASSSGAKVRLSYKHRAASLPWLGETSFFVTGVEPIEGRR